jgi:hypothetical protein
MVNDVFIKCTGGKALACKEQKMFLNFVSQHPAALDIKDYLSFQYCPLCNTCQVLKI